MKRNLKQNFFTQENTKTELATYLNQKLSLFTHVQLSQLTHFQKSNRLMLRDIHISEQTTLTVMYLLLRLQLLKLLA